MSDVPVQPPSARLDAHVRDIVRWHFDPATGCPFWLERAKTLGFDPGKDVGEPRRPRQVRPVRGRVAARRPGPALGPEGVRRPARVRVRDRRHDRRAEDPHQRRGLPHRLRAVQRDAAGRQVSEGIQLADARAERSAPAAPGDRASRAAPRRHLLRGRSRSALGDQADPEGLERADAGLQGSRHRTGGDDPQRRPRHPVHVHDAEAARGAGEPARRPGHLASARPASPAFFPAAPSSRRSGTASRTKSSSTAPT